MAIFVEIADQGSLVAAARVRGIAPSAVTASLKRLEDRVGAQLVQRSTRQLALTSEGARFLPECRRILGQIDEAIDQLSPEGPVKGRLRITTINDFGRTRVAGLIDGFLAENPDMQIDLVLGDDVTDLIGGGFDLAIRTGPLVDSRLVARLLLRSGRSICASPDYWRRHGKPQHPDELADHNCLRLSRAGEVQTQWSFQKDGHPFTVPVDGDRSATDGGLLRAWAIAGAGVIVKTDYDIEADIAEGRLETVLDAYRITGVNLYAVHVASDHPPRRLEAFLRYLDTHL